MSRFRECIGIILLVAVAAVPREVDRLKQSSCNSYVQWQIIREWVSVCR